MLTAGRISRRDFLKRSAALGVSFALADGVLSKTASADAITPKRGGHLILGVNGASPQDTLDPANIVAVHLQIVGMQLYNALVEVDIGSDIRGRPVAQPALAESWEAKPGAKEWTIKLRKDVTFHNGKSMTAADVVYSLNHHRKKDSKSSAKSLLEPIIDIKATDKHEVKITLNSGNADIPYLLADYHLAIGPEGTNFLDGVGTGAYVLEKFEPGVRGLTKRNPNHYRSDRGFVDSVETLAINDPKARIDALLAGKVHLINRVEAKSVLALSRNPACQVFEISGGAHYTFPMRCDTAPYNNNSLRLALKCAVDRYAMVDKVLYGHGKVGKDVPISPYDRFQAADIPQRQFDPDLAKFHYKKSGHSGPLVLSVSEGAFTGAVACAEIIQQGAAKAGINVQLDRAAAETYWDNVWLKKPWCASYWSGRPTADLMLSVVYKSDAAWNESAWKRPDFDKLLAVARAELDYGKRKQMYRDLQMMIYEDGGEIIPMFNNTIDAGSSKVKGFNALPTYELSGYRAPEKVWLE
ncbi:MAG: twin-arginine translocation signal domain-containing protein [Gammaproteobacteria bacterium]|nr:twin-arginine translocation signal domain-containing protein [Gammaproteobacteria bacterium]